MNENKNKTRKKSEQPWDKKKKRPIDRPVKPDENVLANPINRLVIPDQGSTRGRLLSRPEVCDASLPSNLFLL